MEMPRAPIEIFCSCAEEDITFLEALQRHLSLLRRSGTIEIWHRSKSHVGFDRKHELDQHLNTASLILLLISPSFLASDDLYGVELHRAMERHIAGEARVIPILLRSCNWTDALFKDLQVLPRNQTPLELWQNLDAGLAEIAMEIQTALKDMEQLTIAAPPTRQPKIWQVPYQRNPVFTGREDLLQTLTQLLEADHSTVLSQPQTQAISGLGGIGKTQVAVEYAYRAAPQYQIVFWIHAETLETLVSGYTNLARALNLPEKDASDQQVLIEAVQRWLQTHRDWLLILDNADDLTLLASFLPPNYGGRVLITTHAQVTGRFAHRMEISLLTNEDGGLLLLRRAGILAEQGNATEVSRELGMQARHISAELGDLPLALDQAGAYIEETGCSLQGYQQQYQQRQAILLARRGQLNIDHPESVATTWSLSFEKIEQAYPIAAQVLRLCAFLAPDAIPEELIVHALASSTLSKAQTPDEEGSFSTPTTEQEKQWEMDEVVNVLRAYSLIQRNSQGATLGVHRLVQAVIREAMVEEERHTWARRGVQMMNEVLPKIITFDTWKQCEQYVPHAQVCVQLAAEGAAAEEADLLHRIGTYLLELQRTQEAGYYVQQALRLREQHLGKEHLETAASLDRVARWWELQGKYADAEPLLVRALAIREQQVGADYRDIAASLNNLALLYNNLGKYTKAEPLYVRALAIQEQQLEADYRDIASSLNNLALLYNNLGKYADAEPLYVRALAIQEQHLGAEHPDTASSLNNLALLYNNLGKYADAELLYVRALAIREQQLGANHPDTAASSNNLAVLYFRQGKYADAEPLYVRALAIREQQLGANHPETATSLNNLALFYESQGKYADAEPLYVRALAIFEQQLGADHHSTQTVRKNHAFLLQMMEQQRKRPD